MIGAGVVGAVLAAVYPGRRSPVASLAASVSSGAETHYGFFGDAVVITPDSPVYGPRYKALIVELKRLVGGSSNRRDTQLKPLAKAVFRKYPSLGENRSPQM
ncbi:MAG: hypothetical protein ABH807_02535, partial [Candidatus Shapirobacteria bacterium]